MRLSFLGAINETKDAVCLKMQGMIKADSIRQRRGGNKFGQLKKNPHLIISSDG